ncbi:MAG: hypothetical protein WBW41_13595 [Verrucomicrobiia bacterium]
MKPDDFEQKLQRQPLRQIPAGWREEILAVAGQESSPARRVPERHWLSTLSHQLSTLLWPHPKAWAGLAAVWILIFAVDFSLRDKTPGVAGKSAPPSRELVAELKQQRRMLAELIGAHDTSDADRSIPLVPRPRSERVEILIV